MTTVVADPPRSTSSKGNEMTDRPPVSGEPHTHTFRQPHIHTCIDCLAEWSSEPDHAPYTFWRASTDRPLVSVEPHTPRERLSRWFRKYRGPHSCLECGRPLTYGHNEAGRWWVACGKMKVSLGDGRLEYNHAGHTVRVTESKPVFDCDHEHVERNGYSPTIGWWE